MESTYIGSNSSADLKVPYPGQQALTENANSGWDISFYDSSSSSYSRACGHLDIQYLDGKYSVSQYTKYENGDTYCELKDIRIDNSDGGFTVSAGSVDTSYSN